MRRVTSEQALSLIGAEDRVLILLETPGEPLCKRARQALLAHEIKLKQLGYTLYSLEVDENSSRHYELSCVRVPQTRLFFQNRLIRKHVGVPSDQFLSDLLSEKFQ